MPHRVVPDRQPAQSIEDPLTALVGSPDDGTLETDAVTVAANVVTAHEDRTEC